MTSDAQALSKSAASMISFCGRKLLFDNELSINLKESPFLDNILAAQKLKIFDSNIDNRRFNLYPSSSGMEEVRLGMIESLRRQGVKIFINCQIDILNSKDRSVKLSNGENLKFDQMFLGCDVRESEKILFKSNQLEKNTYWF